MDIQIPRWIAPKSCVLLFPAALALALGCGQTQSGVKNGVVPNSPGAESKGGGSGSITTSGLPPKGKWIERENANVDTKKIAESQSNFTGDRPLLAALKANGGNFAKALESMRFHVGVDASGNITGFSDPNLSGRFNDEDLALLSQAQTLTNMHLRDAHVTDVGMAALAKMPQLRELSLETKSVTDAGLAHLQHLSKLESLDLEGAQITGTGLTHIPNPLILKKLDLMHCPISEDGLKQVARFSNLELLVLWGSPITDSGVEVLISIPKLQSLDLSDTRVTDACLPSILKMANLKDVSFGDKQISVSTFERLEAKGIDVGHGTLLNVRREENLLRYEGMDFEVDTHKSSLRAFVAMGRPGITWQLEVECTDKYVPGHMQPAHLEGPPMDSLKKWRELVGEEFQITYKDSELHPILPDNPCNIYVGWHAAPNRHHIKFKKLTGNRFLIDWHCDAKQSQNDSAEPVWVNAEIPFVGFTVWSEKKFSLDEAKKTAARYFDLSEFHEPRLEESNIQTRVIFDLAKAKP